MEINPTIFFVCNDFERALGLELLLPNFHIVCIDYNHGIEVARKAGAKIFCLEESLGSKNPIYRNSNRLLNVHEVQDYIKKNTTDGETPNVMFFKIAPNIEQTCKQLGYKILNTTADLNQMFELKLSQYEKLGHDPDIRFPETVIDQLSKMTYEKLVEKLGSPFVIQYDRGHTGSSTVFVERKETFEEEKKLFPLRYAKFSKKIDGDAWTLNACVARDGILYGGLSYQITGITECTSKKGGTVGNDWTVSDCLSENTLNQIKKITTRSGEIMKANGFRGLYGLDFIVDPTGEVYLIEINARQPASTGMHTKLLLQDEKMPLQMFHIAEFLYAADDDAYYEFLNKFCCKMLNRANAIDVIAAQNEIAVEPISACQILMRNRSKDDIHANLPFNTGVYTYDPINKKITFVRDGYCVAQLYEKTEFLLLLADEGRVISPEIEIGRIQSKTSLLDQDLLPSQQTMEIIKSLVGKS